MKRKTIAWFALAASIIIVLMGLLGLDDFAGVYIMESIVEPVCCWLPALIFSGAIVTSEGCKRLR